MRKDNLLCGTCISFCCDRYRFVEMATKKAGNMRIGLSAVWIFFFDAGASFVSCFFAPEWWLPGHFMACYLLRLRRLQFLVF